MLLLFVITEKLLHIRLFGGAANPSSSCPVCEELKSNGVFCHNCGRFLKKYQIRLTKRFWTKIVALLLVSYIVTFSIQAPVFAFAQGLTLTNPNPEASLEVFPQISGYQMKFLYRDKSFEKIAGQDASLLYAYFPQNVSNPTVYVLVGVSSSITNLHSWEVCLVTWQTARGYSPLVSVTESRDIQIVENPPIIARYFVFEHPTNYTQVTLYWYQKALFKTGLTIESKYTRISLIILTTNPSDSPKLEPKLLSMGQTVAAFWEPLKTQSMISLGIPTMQVLLGASLIFATILQTTQYTKDWRRKTTKLKIFEKLAAPKEKLLYKTIKELRQTTKETTTQNIASTFWKASGQAVELNELIYMLDNLEMQKIIKADIIGIQSQPRLVWKT
jgi:hypothetical protein